MAEDFDPQDSARKAEQQLATAISALDEHIIALHAPTAELALLMAKAVTEGGELEPGSMIRKFVSAPGTPSVGAQIPGGLGKFSSEAAQLPRQPGEESTGSRFNEMFGAEAGRQSPAGSPQWQKEQSVISGRTNIEAQRLEEETIRIPSFGDWRIDAALKLGSQMLGKKAIGNYNKYASNAEAAAEQALAEGETPSPTLSPQEWAEQQGGLSAGRLSGLLAKGSEGAVLGSVARTYIKPAADFGTGAAKYGASLGLNPQNAPGGLFWHGIPNPLAMFSSAGEQTMGMVVNAAEQAFGGTGISYGEAKGLEEALANQGWANQRSGGLLGATVGGERTHIAQAFEPLMKMGFGQNEETIKQLGEWSNAMKLGAADPHEIAEQLKQLPELAKTLHKTLGEVTAGMEEFAAKAVEGGSTMIHGARAYNSVGAITGINPTLVQKINESNFGQIQAISQGVLPWQIAGTSGGFQAENAAATVERLKKYVPKQTDTYRTNKVTGRRELVESGEEKEMSWIHRLDPDITNEEAKRLLHINKGGHGLEAVSGGISLAQHITSNRYKKEAFNASETGAVYKEGAAQKAAEEAASHLHHLQVTGASQWDIEEAATELMRKKEAFANLAHKASSHAARVLKGSEQQELIQELKGEHGLYNVARKAGISEHELQTIQKDPVAKQSKKIQEALEKINKVNIEKKEEAEGKENTKIELGPGAKAFFKLHYPSQLKKMEANEGKSSTASSAAQPTPGSPSAITQAAERQIANLTSQVGPSE